MNLYAAPSLSDTRRAGFHARPSLVLFALALQTAAVLGQGAWPVVELKKDNLVVDRSVRIRIPSQLVIEDSDGNGVIQVKADGITITFEEGGVLRGAPPGRSPDEIRGVGLSIRGRTGVTIRGLHARGFRLGIDAEHANGLIIDGADFSGMFRQRLKSTPEAEDASDWLQPHVNDDGHWARDYGACVRVRRSHNVTIRRSRGRESQNGILLEWVEDSRVYDNDFSFLSGWGLALWRSSDNLVSRNAFDFCVRGYSHGVYNRGQDSAGILMFEQCSRNRIVENSATHGGDGFFGFGGKEALGETKAPQGFDSKRKGNNDNLIVGNDFSDAVAHGLEMTFSFGNRIENNIMNRCGICGIWGGYSRDTLIVRNHFEQCGDAGYGLERGGVNIEHGQRDVILDNDFVQNRCGVHLWWDADEAIARLPWGRRNGMQVADNAIARNRFRGDDVAIHLRHSESTTTLLANVFDGVTKELLLEASAPSKTPRALPTVKAAPYRAMGQSRPVGAHEDRKGREHIIVSTWGPWDGASPLLRRVSDEGSAQVWEVLGAKSSRVTFSGDAGVVFRRAGEGRWRVEAKTPGLHRFGFGIPDGPSVSGHLLSIAWRVACFPTPIDPREDEGSFRALAERAHAISVPVLDLPFGMQGPSALAAKGRPFAPGLPRDHFGTVADGVLRLAPGSYQLVVTSDDGVRVELGGERLVDDWTHHAPRTVVKAFQVDEDKPLPLHVEHFELDGFAVLRVTIRPTHAR